MKRENMRGRKFGRITAIAPAPTRKGDTRWHCRCSCGTEWIVYTKALKRGKTVSCGCRKEQHGASQTVEYSTFRRMADRCNNPNAPDFHLYGARGIKVEFTSFRQFLAEVGPRPSTLHSIDRKNSNGNYAPSNVRWATAREQANNMRTNRRIAFQGAEHTLSEWGRITGFGRSVIEARLDRLGWSLERALTTPIQCASSSPSLA